MIPPTGRDQDLTVIVCGGRDYSDRARVRAVLDELHAARPVSLLVHGNAPGADQLAEWWAHTWHIPVQREPAEWDLHGPAAGPIRNQRMLRLWHPDLVVAFPGGKGTADMVAKARAAGVPVWEPEVAHAQH